MKKFIKTLTILPLLLLNLNFIIGQTASVKLEVRVPTEGLKKEGSIFLAGSFNCWNPHDSLYIMQKNDDNIYVLTIPVFEGQKCEYKFTQGDWGTVETSLDGSEMKNRQIISHNGITIYDTVMKWKSQLVEQKKDTSMKLNADQIKEFAKIKEEMEKNLEKVKGKFLSNIKPVIENMLSAKPSKKLRAKYHKQLVAEINRILDMGGEVLWKLSEILTPDQKKVILSEMEKTNGDILGTISNLFNAH